MNIQIRKFYEADEIGGGSIDWYKYYCRVNKELSKANEMVKEKDLIIHGLEEGSENWKAEYDNCRALLQELVDLKALKETLYKDNHEGKEYAERKTKAWEAAKKYVNGVG